MKKGDIIETSIEIIKTKKRKEEEKATVIKFNGERYVLKHENQYQGGSKK